MPINYCSGEQVEACLTIKGRGPRLVLTRSWRTWVWWVWTDSFRRIAKHKSFLEAAKINYIATKNKHTFLNQQVAKQTRVSTHVSFAGANFRKQKTHRTDAITLYGYFETPGIAMSWKHDDLFAEQPSVRSDEPPRQSKSFDEESRGHPWRLLAAGDDAIWAQ